MDNLTKEQRRENMRNIKSTGTVAEKIVMQELRKRKIYCAKNVKTIIGKPDIVFRRKKVIVFIDSDFWHGHPQRFIMPKTNIERNKSRDVEVTENLQKEGWTIIRLWEYDIKHDLDKCINTILKTLNAS